VEDATIRRFAAARSYSASYAKCRVTVAKCPGWRRASTMRRMNCSRTKCFCHELRTGLFSLSSAILPPRALSMRGFKIRQYFAAWKSQRSLRRNSGNLLRFAPSCRFCLQLLGETA
jgi:hypothetical protein